MDWYVRSGIDDFCIVPKDQELSDRLPSPDSWSQWGISTPEGFGVPNKEVLTVTDSAKNDLNLDNQKKNLAGVDSDYWVDFKTSLSDIGMQGGALNGTLDENSLFGDPEFKLDDLEGVEQTDEIFLNSVLEDLPGDKKMSPSSLSWLDMIDSLNMTTNKRCMASSECLGGSSISPPGTYDTEATTSTSTPSNTLWGSMSCSEAPSTDTFPRYQQVYSHGDSIEEMSLEESVLHDLELVMGQLTENTRICLRDALYRLAASSRQRPALQSHSETYSKEGFPLVPEPNKCMRSEKKVAEAETNTFDRAIANILFDRMDIHMHDFSTGSFASSNHQGPGKRGM